MSDQADFNSELADYLEQSKAKSQDWIFDESTGVYVIHSQRRVMYSMDDQWICGDYDSIYTQDRYIFDSNTQTWFDTMTKEYSIFDEQTQAYIALTDDYLAGRPEGTQSIRFIVESSPHFERGQVVIVDENGMTIGRDRSWDSRLRLPEMIVSKYHAMVYLDKQKNKKRNSFYIIDNGSQHGTFVNETRLSESKQSSLPYELQHLDIVRIGSTSLTVHDHVNSWPCSSCVTSDPINIHLDKKPKEKAVINHVTSDELEQRRKDWLKEAKKMYRPEPDTSEKNYIDRAEIRRQNTEQEKFVDPYRKKEQIITYTQHTTIHTPVQGIGNKMLRKLGWQEGQSLGKDQTGILEPILPISQSSRSGLGSEKTQTPLANEPRRDKQWRLAKERYENTFSE